MAPYAYTFINMLPYAQYFTVLFSSTIDDVSYVSIVADSSLLEALCSYCCQSSVSILVGAGSQHY